MPIIDEEVKTWFLQMCKDFAASGFVVTDIGSKESVRIDLPETLLNEVGYSYQFATIQYMGCSRSKPSNYDSIEVRFYAEGLKQTGLISAVHERKSLRKQQWNGPNPYYHYNVSDYYEFERYVKPILDDAKSQFEIQSLLKNEVPQTLFELPRYK